MPHAKRFSDQITVPVSPIVKLNLQREADVRNTTVAHIVRETLEVKFGGPKPSPRAQAEIDATSVHAAMMRAEERLEKAEAEPAIKKKDPLGAD